MKKKYFLRLFLIGLCLTGLWAMQRLLEPKYEGRVIEGNFIAEYYDEEVPHELLILGDCEVYENISPIILWEEFGISSYIRGSAQQLMAQSFYLLEDTLRYETPRAVLLSISAMPEEQQVNEAYNRMTMDGMRWSLSKLRAIEATKTDEEHLVEYLFPLLRYHSRWKELDDADFRYFWKRPKVSHNGYYMRADVQAAADFPTQRRRADYQFPAVSYAYLDKIRSLCRENNIQLLLYKAPGLYPSWYEQWDSQIAEYAKTYGLDYINCIPLIETIGLDFAQDTYNGGQHLNIYGAEKLSRYLGSYLLQQTDLQDLRNQETYQLVWEKKRLFYNQMKQEQEEEWNTLGYLKRFSENKIKEN